MELNHILIFDQSHDLLLFVVSSFLIYPCENDIIMVILFYKSFTTSIHEYLV